MTRRAKLNLTPDEKTSEKQPVSFQPDDGTSKAETQQEKTAQHQTEKPAAQSAENVEDVTPNTVNSSAISLPSWLNRKNLLKAALLAGAAAVTVIYIKRRFR